MYRYLLEVMYDGTKFHGSQIQGTQVTVQLEINKALSTICRTPIISYGASRTDEGVHALCNCYHFDIEPELTFDLVYKCNALLPHSMAIKNAWKVAPDFNARFDAISRRYRYRIYSHKNPFMQDRGMFFPFKLNEEILQETAKIITEYTQFQSFAKRKGQSKTFDCTIMQSYWQRDGDELQYIVEGNRFLRGMVRGLVGTQIAAARGKISIQDFRSIIEARDCTRAFFDVPGHGLYLEDIQYKEGTLVAINLQTV